MDRTCVRGRHRVTATLPTATDETLLLRLRGHCRGRCAQARILLRRNWIVAVLLTLGLALRVMAMLAYYPALIYIDSFGYIKNAYLLQPATTNPLGYSLFLRGMLDVSNLTTVAVVQHLLGLAMAVTLYALLRRYRVRRWLAAAAVAPLLLDGYQLQIEQNILSEPLFEALMVAAITVLAWNRRPSLPALGVAGLLIGASITVRSVGEVLIVVLVVYPLLVIRGWRRRTAAVVIAVAGFAVPLAGYAGFYYYRTGQIGLSGQPTDAFYGRAATIADCAKLPLTASERVLCPTLPPGQRYGVDYYLNSPASPLGQQNADAAAGRAHIDTGAATSGFVKETLLHQPWAFTRAVAGDFLHGFSTTSHVAPSDTPSWRWQFQTTYPIWLPTYSMQSATNYSALGGQGAPRVNTALATTLRDYQLNGGSTPGPLLGAAALLAVAACCTWARRVRDSGLRPLCFLIAAVAISLLSASDVFEYSLRYQLPGIVLLPAAGAAGLSALTWQWKARRHRHAGPDVDTGTDTSTSTSTSTDTDTDSDTDTELDRGVDVSPVYLD
jgi:hypothetical protein